MAASHRDEEGVAEGDGWERRKRRRVEAMAVLDAERGREGERDRCIVQTHPHVSSDVGRQQQANCIWPKYIPVMQGFNVHTTSTMVTSGVHSTRH